MSLTAGPRFHATELVALPPLAGASGRTSGRGRAPLLAAVLVALLGAGMAGALRVGEQLACAVTAGSGAGRSLCAPLETRTQTLFALPITSATPVTPAAPSSLAGGTAAAAVRDVQAEAQPPLPPFPETPSSATPAPPAPASIPATGSLHTAIYTTTAAVTSPVAAGSPAAPSVPTPAAMDTPGTPLLTASFTTARAAAGSAATPPTRVEALESKLHELKRAIDLLDDDLRPHKEALAALESELDSLERQYRETGSDTVLRQFNHAIHAFNTAAFRHNELIDRRRRLVDAHNAKVDEYNRLIGA